ncbi:MAG: S-layer homology domain-containing protein [Oscillospiraceae bacterium]|nr:S-layer homology domain-containing protein [Oscillospiraceae bacterium]
MKNFKRFLSLALAGTMLSGMMAMGASAADTSDFSDAAEIVHTEAVDVMASLGVLKGKDTGAFDPNGTVTRAEMAKIITVMLNGGSDPTLGTSNTAMFSDIQNHWAKNYIEYCANMNIIAGQGDGTFAPDAPVTGNAAAKMLLVAMGYDSGIFEFTGPDWALNVARRANDAKLFEEIKTIDANAGLSRDNTAQMAYNALSAKVMVTTYDKVVSSGEVSWNYRLADETFLEKYFGVIKVVGTVTENEFTDGSTLAGKTTLDVTNYGATEEQDVFNDSTYNFASDADTVGKSVTVYLKPYANNNSNVNRATIIGTPIVNTNNQIFATAKKLVNDDSKSNDVQKTLKAEGLRFEDGNTVTTFVNFDVTDTEANPKTNVSKYVNTKGWEAQYIDNDGDGKIDVVTYVKKAFGKVTVSSTAGNGTLTVNKLGALGVDETVAGGVGASALSTNKAEEKVAGWDDLEVKKNDYVTYYYVKGADTYYVEKMTGKTVTVNALTSDDTIKTSDGNFTKSGIASATDIDEAAGSNATLHSAVELGKDAVLYLDAAGSVIYVAEVETTTAYLMIQKVSSNNGNWDDTLTARAIFEDGTKGEINITKIDATEIDGNNAGTQGTALEATQIDKAAAGKIYSYEKDSKGNYELKTETTKQYSSTDVSNVKPQIKSDIVANKETKFIMNTSGSSYALYTGIDNVASRDGAQVFAVTNSSNIAKVVFTYGGTGAASANNYMYFLSKNPTITKDSDGDNVYTYDVIRNGEVTTIVGDSRTLVPDAGVYMVTFTGTEATSATGADSALVPYGAAVTASAGVIANSVGSYYYNDATRVFRIDGDTPDDVTETSIEAIITEGGAQDTIAMILGTNTSDNQTAKYVFVQENDSAPKSAETVAVVVDTIPDADDASSKTSIVPTVTLTEGTVEGVVDGSSEPIELFNINGTELPKVPGATSAAVVKIKLPVASGTSISAVKYTTTDMSDTGYTQAGTTDIAIDASNSYVYMVIYNNTAVVKITAGGQAYHYACTPW